MTGRCNTQNPPSHEAPFWPEEHGPLILLERSKRKDCHHFRRRFVELQYCALIKFLATMIHNHQSLAASGHINQDAHPIMSNGRSDRKT